MTGKGLAKVLRCTNCSPKVSARRQVVQHRTFTSSASCQKHGKNNRKSDSRVLVLLFVCANTVKVPFHCLQKPHLLNSTVFSPPFEVKYFSQLILRSLIGILYSGHGIRKPFRTSLSLLKLRRKISNWST